MKKIIALVFAVIMSVAFTSTASAANTFGSVNVPPRSTGYTETVDGQGQYGRITLEGTVGSYPYAFVEVYSNGQWKQPTINDPELGFLSLINNVSRDTDNYYFEKGKKYRLYVSTLAEEYSAKGYIRTYD
ncbi:hypothetical protein [Bacillus safensis]|uniref:hypothetical protein n=1 Tax=Bacillus safensis TaxID=561879 RepID=UPI001CD5D748|nr:hypothetical protein [Bacillus safensis]